jgi:hypothetical protein
MTSLLEGALAKSIYKAARKQFMKAVLSRNVDAGGSPAAPAYDPAPFLTQTYDCLAIPDFDLNTTEIVGFATQKKMNVIILTESLAVEPLPNDRIEIFRKGISLGMFTVLDRAADPARATWTCTVRV